MFPTEGFQPTLSKLTPVLDRLRIRYHLTGGIAAVAYGEPRMTQDVDLVLDRDRVIEVEDEFLGALHRAGFHFGEQAARQAIASRQMFQLLDVDQVIKLDLYVRCLIPGELDRSVRTEIFPGVELPVACRADAALSKLVWIRHGSHRSRRDLRRILAGASRDELRTVEQTAGEMVLADLLAEVLNEQDEIGA
jgi:Nucleotidyl transferase AbiEii toxin, Type IV TA system